MVDIDRGYLRSVLVETKGPQCRYAVRVLAQFADELGAEKVTIQMDQEKAIRALAEAVKARRKSQTFLRYIESKQSNGHVESANRQVEGQMRCLKRVMEEKYGVPITLKSPVLPWLVRHAAWLIAGYRKQSDGHTSYFRVHGRERHETILTFGKSCMLRAISTESKSQPRWVRGIWVGKTHSSAEHYVLSASGVIVSRTVRRMPEALQWQGDIMKEARGLPWAPKATDDDEEKPKKEEPIAVLPMVHDTGTATPLVNQRPDGSSLGERCTWQVEEIR